MNLKTFTSDSMSGALALVRRELGAGAVILHTRSFKRGGLWGIGARTVVEVTAADGREVGRRKREGTVAGKAQGRPAPPRAQSSSASPSPSPSGSAAQVATSAATSAPAGAQPLAGDLIRRTYAAARAEFEKQITAPTPAATTQLPAASHAQASATHPSHAQPAHAQSLHAPPVLAQPSHAAAAAPAAPATAFAPRTAPYAPVSPSHRATTATVAVAERAEPVTKPITVSAEQLAEEMQVVKRLIARMMRQQREHIAATAEAQDADASDGSAANNSARRPRNAMDMPDALFDQYLALIKQEVSEDLAEEVIRKVRFKLGRRQMEDPAKVRSAVQEAVANLIPTDVAAASAQRAPDGRPRTIALIGPTGVGKTTTVAKLAANFKLRQKKNVGLITVDTYRIAAVDQLRTYADIIGVQLQVVTNASEMAEAVQRCSACDVILIDTVGRSPKDDARLGQLAELLEAANPHEVHLVLSSTCTQSALLDAVEKFSRMRADRLIFTKLDEAVTFGVLLNVVRKVNKQLSFVTTGQEVPHHIEAGRPKRLAALVLGEGI